MLHLFPFAGVRRWHTSDPQICHRQARWAAAASSVVAALLLAEASLRLLGWPPEDPVWMTCRETAFQFAPNVNYRHMSTEFDVEFRTNRLGLRDDEVGPKRGYRILLLGDSFTCGYGVERPRLFADLIEEQLQMEVINAGVGGFDIVHQLHYFRSRGRELRPDLVVYALYLNNDLTGNRQWRTRRGGELTRRDGKPALQPRGTAKLVCLARSFVPLRRLIHAFRRRAVNQPETQPGERYLALCADRPDQSALADYQVARDLLIKLRDEVKSSGAEFLIVSFPLRAVVETTCPEAYRPGESRDGQTYNLLRPVARMAEMLDSAGIDHIPLTGALRDARQRLATALYYPSDGHFNALGHRLFAELLVPPLRARLLPTNCEPSSRDSEAPALRTGGAHCSADN